MLRLHSFIGVVPILLVLSLLSVARAENEGLADLDKATDLQLSADSVEDLEAVAKLCETALEKGLDEEKTQFAKQLVSSVLYDHANRLAQSLLSERVSPQRFKDVRTKALQDLERAVHHSPNLGDAYVLLARLQALPGGDREAAIKAAGEAVRCYEDDKPKRSKALVFRAALQTDPDKQLEDFNAAIECDGENVEAWQGRAVHYLAREQFEKAAEDFTKLLETQGNNPGMHNALAEALFNLKKYDEALQHVNKAIELRPEMAVSYLLRARLHAVQEKLQDAVEDLDKALKIEPRDLGARLLRARLYHVLGETAKARSDVDLILRFRPDLEQAILLRSLIAASEGKLSEAISDVQTLLKTDPKNTEWRFQLATLQVAAGRPRRAIEIFSEILQDDPENWMVLRSRGDALLSVGKHGEAIQDYEKAIKIEPSDDGILNNFAWVLATSPKDELRDGKRSLEMATKACEVTKYQRPHILSTLAAAYAETGDFENARKWSEKAVEQGKDELKEQLQKELDSYKDNKPWREIQETEEKPEPVVAPKNAVDT